MIERITETKPKGKVESYNVGERSNKILEKRHTLDITPTLNYSHPHSSLKDTAQSSILKHSRRKSVRIDSVNSYLI